MFILHRTNINNQRKTSKLVSPSVFFLVERMRAGNGEGEEIRVARCAMFSFGLPECWRGQSNLSIPNNCIWFDFLYVYRRRLIYKYLLSRASEKSAEAIYTAAAVL